MTLKNFSEKFRYKISRWLSKGLRSELDEAIEDYEQMRKSVFYRRHDYFYLAKNGWTLLKDCEYNKDDDDETYHKREVINYGKYPGTYDFYVTMPITYPKSPPIIHAKTNISNVSHHIIRGDVVCISKHEGGQPQTYWKKEMNVRGAIKLALHVITNNINAKERKVKDIKDTIFADLATVMQPKDFIQVYRKISYFRNLADDYTWEELAYALKGVGYKLNKSFIETYNLTKSGTARMISIASLIRDDDGREDEDGDE